MTKQEVIEQLCQMMTRVWSNLDPNAQRPCDCVCRETGMRYQNSGEALEFMERAVSDALARRAAVSGSGEKVACCACTAVFIETGTASGCPDHRAPDSVSDARSTSDDIVSISAALSLLQATDPRAAAPAFDALYRLRDLVDPASKTASQRWLARLTHAVTLADWRIVDEVRDEMQRATELGEAP